jgi:queuine tRNA-ribosyltransferase
MDYQPLDPNCKCKVCDSYSRAYIHHLIKTEELIGYNLISFHNVYFMLQLMKEIREAIKTETMKKIKKEWI